MAKHTRIAMNENPDLFCGQDDTELAQALEADPLIHDAYCRELARRLQRALEAQGYEAEIEINTLDGTNWIHADPSELADLAQETREEVFADTASWM